LAEQIESTLSQNCFVYICDLPGGSQQQSANCCWCLVRRMLEAQVVAGGSDCPVARGHYAVITQTELYWPGGRTHELPQWRCMLRHRDYQPASSRMRVS